MKPLIPIITPSPSSAHHIDCARFQILPIWTHSCTPNTVMALCPRRASSGHYPVRRLASGTARDTCANETAHIADRTDNKCIRVHTVSQLQHCQRHNAGGVEGEKRERPLTSACIWQSCGATGCSTRNLFQEGLDPTSRGNIKWYAFQSLAIYINRVQLQC